MHPGRFQQSVNKNRRGFIKVSSDMLFSQSDDAQKVLSKILIIKTDSDLMNGVNTYWGYCECFDPIEKGELTPEYQVIINTVEGFFDSFQFKRVK